MDCVLCKKKILPIGKWEGGHNAMPLKAGRCCGNCNNTKVIPARIGDLQERKEDGKRKKS